MVFLEKVMKMAAKLRLNKNETLLSIILVEDLI